MKAKRGYSRDFTPGDDAGHNYLITRAPAGLWSAVRAQAKREGLSLRAFILTALQARVQAGQVQS